MYYHGQGVQQSYVYAYFWFNLASAYSSPGTMRDRAIRQRDLAAAKLAPAQLTRTQELASAWRPCPERPETPVESSPKTATPPQPVQTATPHGALIGQVQKRLLAAGFNPCAIDGDWGPQTRNALRSFQNTQGIQATGELDEVTLDALGVR
jgi:localization factor PodJL